MYCILYLYLQKHTCNGNNRADLLALWNRKVNAAYSQQYSSTQQSALLNEALIKVLEDIYRNGLSNYITDQVRALVSTENVETTTK